MKVLNVFNFKVRQSFRQHPLDSNKVNTRILKKFVHLDNNNKKELSRTTFQNNILTCTKNYVYRLINELYLFKSDQNTNYSIYFISMKKGYVK